MKEALMLWIGWIPSYCKNPAVQGLLLLLAGVYVWEWFVMAGKDLKKGVFTWER